MILADIEREVNDYCDNCSDVCKRYSCLCFRIKQILDIGGEGNTLNIDDFFETREDKNQIDMW